ncbi:Protein CBG26744 [Caenorhabditis briggsae]|uniref:Protein CBG26744 n=1 Tax=Caenorhabditis briggsae TaxID=6238 RepID=B6IEB9_CAEBR|nr:Protein CBG26744 [Caenorhabditis briggsae]CAS01183.1 Protein CBG26744 [Caenorhabditis briggsae]
MFQQNGASSDRTKHRESCKRKASSHLDSKREHRDELVGNFQKDELFKICEIGIGKRRNSTSPGKTPTGKPKVRDSTLIKINTKVTNKKKEPVEEMEFEEAASENIRNEAVTMDKRQTL